MFYSPINTIWLFITMNIMALLWKGSEKKVHVLASYNACVYMLKSLKTF